jgi:hypothetical protein
MVGTPCRYLLLSSPILTRRRLRRIVAGHSASHCHGKKESVGSSNYLNRAVLGLEELGDLVGRLFLTVLILVDGDEAVADGALELHAVLRALDHHHPE